MVCTGMEDERFLTENSQFPTQSPTGSHCESAVHKYELYTIPCRNLCDRIVTGE